VYLASAVSLWAGRNRAFRTDPVRQFARSPSPCRDGGQILVQHRGHPPEHRRCPSEVRALALDRGRRGQADRHRGSQRRAPRLPISRVRRGILMFFYLEPASCSAPGPTRSPQNRCCGCVGLRPAGPPPRPKGGRTARAFVCPTKSPVQKKWRVRNRVSTQSDEPSSASNCYGLGAAGVGRVTSPLPCCAPTFVKCADDRSVRQATRDSRVQPVETHA
jgi:hypothetical protein